MYATYLNSFITLFRIRGGFVDKNRRNNQQRNSSTVIQEQENSEVSVLSLLNDTTEYTLNQEQGKRKMSVF